MSHHRKFKIGDKVNNYIIKSYISKGKYECTCSVCGKSKQRSIQDIEKHACRHSIDSLYPKAIYTSFKSMKARCYDSTHHNYKNYGGRGIIICPEWLQCPVKFAQWSLSEGGWKPGLQIDRIDVNGNYEPNNCHWVLPIENLNNRRNNVYLTIDNTVKSMAEWSRHFGIPYYKVNQFYQKHGSDILIKRFIEGWDNYTKHIRKDAHILNVKGMSKTCTQWSKYFGYSRSYFSNLCSKHGEDYVKSIIANKMEGK